jgi:hypothetical protein
LQGGSETLLRSNAGFSPASELQMKSYAIAAAALMFAAPAFAQNPMTPANPANDRPAAVTNPGGGMKSGPGSDTTVSTEATGAGNVSTNPAASGNAGQPSRAADAPGSAK